MQKVEHWSLSMFRSKATVQVRTAELFTPWAPPLLRTLHILIPTLPMGSGGINFMSKWGRAHIRDVAFLNNNSVLGSNGR